MIERLKYIKKVSKNTMENIMNEIINDVCIISEHLCTFTFAFAKYGLMTWLFFCVILSIFGFVISFTKSYELFSEKNLKSLELGIEYLDNEIISKSIYGGIMGSLIILTTTHVFIGTYFYFLIRKIFFD